MFIRHIQTIARSSISNYMFATAVTKDALNYYQVLQLD